MLFELHHWRNFPRGRGLCRLADLVGDRDGRNLRSGARANRLLQRFLNGEFCLCCSSRPHFDHWVRAALLAVKYLLTGRLQLPGQPTFVYLCRID